ncbi:glycosyltransferase family 2 protein [Mangrovimonas aestuarii]|uniref:glycosyltransferase family 2 protein n=1 Tax=Mangrovimonas aestuarii TaxID=3018443 RepID=UPI002379B057|nr:glycosyltransferase family 2 protein [Mangrovimonas aestuarii]
MTRISVIIPAFNEEHAIGKVIKDIPKSVQEIIVVNNGSIDNTALVAQKAGATVLTEPRKGYGYACLKGIEHIGKQSEKTDIVVFLDGDYSDYPEELSKLIKPIVNDNIDFVIGSRVKRLREGGAMTPQQVFGNWLATSLMNKVFDANYTDLGPFRAITYDKLLAINMQDKTYGWTVEMQLKALKHKLKYIEIPVRYKCRIGESKVSGTVKGTIMAGYKILGWILKYSISK